MENIVQYFDGKNLYGDDFTQEQITQWYNIEAEAYANMSGIQKSNDSSYEYHHLNNFYAYRYFKNHKSFHNVLGLGSSWGHEFLPIIKKIQRLTIIESSLQTRSSKLGENLVPNYQLPHVDGHIDAEDNSFDLITCFDVMHHIPNVSFVLKELFRVLQPNGFLLLREPIHSMGDWRKKRPFLTSNERGIPKSYFKHIIEQNGIDVVQKNYYFCMTDFLKRTFPALKTDAWWYLYLDKLLSRLLTFNIHYHPTTKIQRMSPTSVFYVLRKPV